MSRTYSHAPRPVREAREEGRKYNKTHIKDKIITPVKYELFFYAHEQQPLDTLIRELENREIEYKVTEVNGFAQEVTEAVVELDGDAYRTVEYKPVNVMPTPSWVTPNLHAQLPLHRNGVSDQPKKTSGSNKPNIFKVLRFTERIVSNRERPVG